MHLLTRKGAQSPGVRTVRLVGASLIATTILVPTALFRVTPAFAQTGAKPVFMAPAAPPTPLTPATPLAPAMPASPAAPSTPVTPAAPPVPQQPVTAVEPAEPASTLPAHLASPAHLSALTAVRRLRALPVMARLQPISDPADHAHAMVIQDDGRIVTDGDFQGLGKDGRFRALSPEEQRRIEAAVHRAMAKAAAAQKFVDSPEFKQKMADIAARQKEFAAIDQAKIQKQVDAAMATLKDARVQAGMARAQAMAASTAMQESLKNAEQIQREVEKAMRDSTPSDEH